MVNEIGMGAREKETEGQKNTDNNGKLKCVFFVSSDSRKIRRMNSLSFEVSSYFTCTNAQQLF